MIKVACALIVKQNKLLVTQLGKQSDHPFLWEFPGGKIEKNETAEEGIKREICEELNLEIRIVVELNSVVYDYGIKKIQLLPFLCEIEKGKLALNEHIDKDWVTLNELELEFVNLVAADRKVIQIQENRMQLKEYLRK